MKVKVQLMFRGYSTEARELVLSSAEDGIHSGTTLEGVIEIPKDALYELMQAEREPKVAEFALILLN